MPDVRYLYARSKSALVVAFLSFVAIALASLWVALTSDVGLFRAIGWLGVVVMLPVAGWFLRSLMRSDKVYLTLGQSGISAPKNELLRKIVEIPYRDIQSIQPVIANNQKILKIDGGSQKMIVPAIVLPNGAFDVVQRSLEERVANAQKGLS